VLHFAIVDCIAARVPRQIAVFLEHRSKEFPGSRHHCTGRFSYLTQVAVLKPKAAATIPRTLSTDNTRWSIIFKPVFRVIQIANRCCLAEGLGL
jgi:hypothetical protein